MKGVRLSCARETFLKRRISITHVRRCASASTQKMRQGVLVLLFTFIVRVSSGGRCDCNCDRGELDRWGSSCRSGKLRCIVYDA